MLVSGTKMSIVRGKYPVEFAAVTDHFIVLLLFVISLSGFTRPSRNVHKNHHFRTRCNVFQIIFKPTELSLLNVTHIVTAEEKHIIKHDIVNISLVKRIVFLSKNLSECGLTQFIAS